MFSRGKFKQAKLLTTLTAALLTGDLRGATMDDELLVDPTTPLILSASVSDTGDSSSEDGEGFGFGLFGLLTSYELTSVLIRAEDRIAVINDERVRVGDKIGSATVASIDADRVTLNVDGEIETLEIYENSIKTPTKGNGDD